MATRRDQLQSYQFLTQRMISAFVMRETDPAQSPLRRGVGAVFGGIMVTVLVGAVFGVYGLLTKIGNSNWKADGAVVVEKETGATFVYLDGVLHPTLNYASALLASGHPGVAARRVASASLSGVPRGVTIGIPDAPTSLPAASRAVGLPWTLCSARGTDSAGDPTTTVTLAAGTSADDTRALGDDQALLVRDRDTRATYLIWDGHRFQTRHPDVVVPALFGAAADPTLVGTAWLNAIPAGTDLTTIPVDHRGAASPVRGYVVGDIVVATSGTVPSYYLVLSDGLAPITEVQRDILTAQYPVRPKPISVSTATSAEHSSHDLEPGGGNPPPRHPPDLITLANSDLVCADFTDATSAPRVSVGGDPAQFAAAIPTRGRTAGGVSLADRVLVPPGRIEVIRTVPGSAPDAGAYSIVTDSGIRYPVPSQVVLAYLGYSTVHAVDVPASLVARLPTGPTLDPAAAVEPAPAAGS